MNIRVFLDFSHLNQNCMGLFYESHPTIFHMNPKSDDNFTEPFCDTLIYWF